MGPDCPESGLVSWGLQSALFQLFISAERGDRSQVGSWGGQTPCVQIRILKTAWVLSVGAPCSECCRWPWSCLFCQSK